MLGGGQNDTLIGAAGNDRVNGGFGRDFARLGDGDDLHVDQGQQGAFAADTIYGGSGQDTLQSGGSDDLLIGGDGADSVRFAATIEDASVQDFEVGTDALLIVSSLWGGGALDQARLNALSDNSSGTLVLDFGPGQSITLQGLDDNFGLLGDIALF